MRTIEKFAVAGGSLSYFRFGEGATPFVILPGMSLKPIVNSATAIAGAYHDFRREFSAFVFNYREPVPADATPRDFAADVAAALDALGVKHACVFGASLGGMVAQWLAIDRPDLVGKLALGSTTAKTPDVGKTAMHEWAALAENRNVVALNRSVWARLYTTAYLTKWADAFAYLEKDGTETECARFVALSQVVCRMDAEADLQNIACPTLVLAAGDDSIFPPVCSEKIAQATGADYFVYEDYCHSVFDEAEDYKDRLMAFFKEQK